MAQSPLILGELVVSSAQSTDEATDRAIADYEAALSGDAEAQYRMGGIFVALSEGNAEGIV